MSKKSGQPVPKIPSPEMDRAPQKYSEKRDGLDDSDREHIFLENADSHYRPLHVQPSRRVLANSSPLPPHRPDISPFFFGTLSVIGLFMLYRAMQNYS